MTIGVIGAREPRAAAAGPAHLATVTVVAGCVALATRPVSPAYVAVTVAIGIAGALHPVDRHAARGAAVWCAAVGVGVASFALARGALGGSLIPPPTAWLMASASAAAVAEEAFFRRLAYTTLLRWGVLAALAGSSITFAIVHVAVWGWRAFPVDLAAGLLLGWQRWVTGSWTAPAVTHVAANVLMLS